MSFDAAVAVAQRELERAQISMIPTLAETTAAIILHFVENDDARSLSSLISASQTEALSWDALRLASADLVRRGLPLPSLMADWLADELEGKRPRPRVPPRLKRGWPGAKEERNLLLHRVVLLLCEMGLKPTRNDVSPAISACDAVATAMQSLKLRPSSFKEIKEIYTALEARYRSGHDPGLGVAVISQLIKDTRGR